MPYFPAALPSALNRLPRQQGGGHSREIFGLELKISINQHLFNEGPPCLGTVLGPQDVTVNRTVFILQECTVLCVGVCVWGGEGGREIEKSTGNATQ